MQATRREYIRTALRWMAVGALGITGVTLVRRPGGRCTVAEACSVCASLRDCQLPQGIRARSTRPSHGEPGK